MNVHIEQIRPELTWKLRQQVLYPAQKLYEMELAEDEGGWHFGAFKDDALVGVVSLFSVDDIFQFRKLAIADAVQKMGIGSSLLSYITGFSKSEGAEMLWCNARTTAINFYLKAGFVQTGNVFSKNGFDYEIMQKAIDKA